MKYKVHRLDKRFSFHDHFEFYIGFTNRMSNQQGPLYFNRAQRWFTETYGWSAEIRQWADMLAWSDTNRLIAKQGFGTKLSNPSVNKCQDCNEYWSWTNGYDDLRIYVKSDKELNFFLLRWPCEG